MQAPGLGWGWICHVLQAVVEGHLWNACVQSGYPTCGNRQGGPGTDYGRGGGPISEAVQGAARSGSLERKQRKDYDLLAHMHCRLYLLGSEACYYL